MTIRRNHGVPVIARVATGNFLSNEISVATRSNLNCSKPASMGGHVYIMCSLNNSTLYTGVSSNLPARVAEHKEKAYPNSFSAKYNCVKLVYYRWFDTIIEAIDEEKRIKGGSRKKKEILINSMNPEWKDLYQETRFR